MISAVVLERAGKLRVAGITTLLLIALIPAAPLLVRALGAPVALTAGLNGSFGVALWNSAAVALTVAVVALLVGLPLGVLAALYEFPGRSIFLALASLPLLVPSFLWAIGWSTLAIRLGPAVSAALSGFAGSVLVFSAGAIPLVLLLALSSAAALSASQVEAARLAGGEAPVFRNVCRHVFPVALLAAGLGGVLTLSDPGPGQILGLRTAASEILISFAALYDFDLAGQQCALLTGLVLLIAAPLACFAAPRLASEMMPRQTRLPQRIRRRPMTSLLMTGLALVILTGTILPVLGLTLPLACGQAFPRALAEVRRTVADTFLYAAGAGGLAALLGTLLAICVGRERWSRILCIAFCLALFALPPALPALGFIQWSTQAPAWTDALLRSRLTVCLALGLRFFPVAALLSLRAWGSMPSSWPLAAGLHGVSLLRYLWQVAFPSLLPTLAVAVLLVALLATADVGTVLLLHPPGEASFPLAIFTVMANAPAALVASLCLLYVAAAGLLLTLLWLLAAGKAP
jgi:iron(III) transport system permease protein